EANFLSGNNIALQADANGITVATKDEVTFDKVTIDGGGPVLDSDGINAGNKKIKNVADGTTDGDAVNLGQLNTAADKATTEVQAGTGIAVSDTSGTKGQTISTVSLDQDTQDSLAKADNAMQGFTTQIDGSDVQTVKDGDDVNFKSGKNIKLSQDGNSIEIATSDDPEFNTVELNTSGAIAENDSHAVTGHAVYEYLEEDGSGIKYFRAKSDKD